MKAFQAVRGLAAKSGTTRVPGVVIDHIPGETGIYIGSPSITVLPNGEYLASHDYFGPKSTQNRTAVFGSRDQGKTWEKRTELEGQFWSTLFVNKGSVYLMGTTAHYGSAIIRRSADSGRTWTDPKDKNSGLLLDDGKYHCAPVPVVVHQGRIWRAMEDALGPGGWGSHFRALMMSAPVDSDLLKAESWIISNRLERNPEWLGGKFGGWLEGNAVVTPAGKIVNILRADYRPTEKTDEERAAIIEVSADGKKITFDAKTNFIKFPGGCKKFTIRYDRKSKLYWSLTNYVPEAHRGRNSERARNTLALVSSPDLKMWKVRSIVLYHPDAEKHAFQYADWQIEGSDLIAVSRTAFDDETGGAHNQHDANYMTFHRFEKFRALTLKSLAANER
ncbi:MAG: exo-alpha-sialidase [Pyrinomonadaceae bacterium]|nr:exo-alpha-sialidase [Pyrinomonadaceae bacterium]